MNEKPETAAAALPANNRAALRRVARAVRKAALATSLAEGKDSRPYVSLVTLAFDHDLSPILLLSRLADHTRNLLADGRAALLLDGTDGHANPQTGPRVTLTGSVAENDDPRLRRRFLARHPGAALYAGFGDFAIWRMSVERAHFVGGFGRAVWFDAPLVAPEQAALMAGAEDSVLEAVNGGRPELVAALAARAGGVAGCGWRLAGIDPDGCELEAGETQLRLSFDLGPDEARPPLSCLQTLAESQSN
ncbi:putative heme iron utilization protein [Paramagnetospirillum caucaseum]|uniref:Putative heme iron utilization protein n=1 Tax=Paramagnetospirillum caucaseum TaxID=1244869 RepID=M2ZAV8_9PROT|nr:pyridoxamine 5'-phosphate oxidase family protein [Paramagnetospirillum caucaseum]EME71540.1 putative heme iron utilization protein [Paramagnetospirillum caucaseum]